MEAVQELKELLYAELEHIVTTSSRLIQKIDPADWEYRPRDTMRSLREIVQHLVSVPAVDLLILQEKSQEEVRRLEAKINADLDKDRLIGWMTTGLHDVKQYMDKLSDEEFLHRKTKPFYLENGSVQAKWLIEIIPHAQHHRAQLFTYLKVRDYEVNMFDLY